MGLRSGLGARMSAWVGVGDGARVEPRVRHQALPASIAPAENGAAEQPRADGEAGRDEREEDHLHGAHLALGARVEEHREHHRLRERLVRVRVRGWGWGLTKGVNQYS